MNRCRGISTLTVLLALLLAAGGFIGWSIYQKAQAKAEVQRIATLAAQKNGELTKARDEFQDEVKIAASTPRIALANSVSRLQNIRQRTQAIEVPECLTTTKSSLVAGMNSGIDAMLVFMRNEGDKYTVQEETSKKAEEMRQAFDNLEKTTSTCPKVQK